MTITVRTKMLVTALAILAVSAPAHAASERTVVKHYVGAPSSAGLVFCGDPRFGGDGAGRSCFTVAAGDTALAVTIADTALVPVAGRIVFFGRETGIGQPPDELGAVSFCGATPAVAIPAGATHLDVEVGDRLERADRPCGDITMGTYGTVTAAFS